MQPIAEFKVFASKPENSDRKILVPAFASLKGWAEATFWGFGPSVFDIGRIAAPITISRRVDDRSIAKAFAFDLRRTPSNPG